MTQIQNKSQLAKLLATENITIQHNPSAKTASFDLKSRVLQLPVWHNVSEDLYDMLVVHEVGHALDTPLQQWTDAAKSLTKKFYGDKASARHEQALRGFLNVIEDARIDKRQKRRYPGSRRNYIAGYKELIERDFFNTSKTDINGLPFIDRLNIYFKGGAMTRIAFDSEEKALLRKAENLETFDDVVALSEEIFAFAKARGEDFRSRMENDLAASGEGEGEDGDFDDDDEDFDFGENDDGDEDSEDGDDGEDSDEDGDASESSSDKDEKKGDEAPKNGDRNDAGDAQDNSDFVPESVTEKAWEQNQSNIVVDDNRNYIYLGLPKVNIKNVVSDYKVVLKDIEKYFLQYYNHDANWFDVYRERMNNFKKEENKVISYMVKEFEMRKSADTYARISISKTGVIDTNKLHSYRYNDDIFRRQTIIPAGKNHGFVMFIDWSGSMHYNLRSTVKQLMSLSLFCKRIQVPFEVYLFRDFGVYDDVCRKNRETFKYEAGKNAAHLGDFRLRNILSSRMSLEEQNRAFLYLWMMGEGVRTCEVMQSTPLNAAILAAPAIVNDFRKKYKLQVVNTVFITDGESNPIDVHSHVNTPGWKPKGNIYILRDDETKKDYQITDINNVRDFNHKKITGILLKMLKDKTGCNLVGFYLAENNFRTYYNDYYVNNGEEHHSKMRKFWNDNGFFAASTAGYDEYFIINSRSMGKLDNNLKVDSGMKKNAIAKEFIRYSESKSLNRVLLSRVMDNLTKMNKEAA